MVRKTRTIIIFLVFTDGVILRYRNTTLHIRQQNKP